MSESAQTADMEDRIDVLLGKIRAMVLEEMFGTASSLTEPNGFYSVSEAAEILEMSKQDLRKAINDGDIEHIRFTNRQIRMRGSAIADFSAAKTVAAV